MATRGRVIPIPGVNEINVGVNTEYNQVNYDTDDHFPPVLGSIISAYAQPEYTVTLHVFGPRQRSQKNTFLLAMHDLRYYTTGYPDLQGVGPYAVLWDLEGPLALTNIEMRAQYARFAQRVWVAVRFDLAIHDRLLPALYSRLESWAENAGPSVVNLGSDHLRPTINYRERTYLSTSIPSFAELGIPTNGLGIQPTPFRTRLYRFETNSPAKNEFFDRIRESMSAAPSAYFQQFDCFSVMEEQGHVFALLPITIDQSGSRMTTSSVVWVADSFDPETQVGKLDALFLALKTSTLNGEYGRLDVPMNLKYSWRGQNRSLHLTRILEDMFLVGGGYYSYSPRGEPDSDDDEKGPKRARVKGRRTKLY